MNLMEITRLDSLSGAVTSPDSEKCCGGGLCSCAACCTCDCSDCVC